MEFSTLARHRWRILGAATVLAVAALLAAPLFLPKASTTVDEAAPAGAVTLKQGSFQGAGDGVHHVSGTVAVVRAEQGYLLRFEDYEATAGPDVFFYLTRAADATATAEVEGGLRVLVPGGSDGGEATLRGDFNVPLPADFDPAAWQGLAVWCDRFDTRFGAAALSEAGPSSL